MYPSITEVTPRDGHRLHLTFDSGEHGILDMKPFLDFGVFQDLKDQTIFQQVRISFDTIEWPGGIDLDPEFVYQHCELKVDQSAEAR